jgi:hypothetical protein
MLNEHFEILIKAETQNNKVIMTKGTELTLKLSTDMISSSRKLFVKTLPHGFLTQNTKKRFWQPKGIPEKGRRHEK